jgi:hypothetical protein
MPMLAYEVQSLIPPANHARVKYTAPIIILSAAQSFKKWPALVDF